MQSQLRGAEERVPTEHFTDALAVVHNFSDASESSRRSRAAAEEYLMLLRDSVEGLNLAFHIISNEDFHEIRCFWAFNTVIHHLPSIAPGMEAGQAREVYATLLSWIDRCCCTPGVPVLPEFVINKHAQMIVAGLQEFFPHRWPDFFPDIFAFLEAKDSAEDAPHAAQIVMYFLRVFQCIDERIVNKNAERTKEQRERDMLIKDTMREQVVERLVGAWFLILCEYRSTNLDVARVCLDAVQTYIDWIDIDLMLDDNWINLFYYFMTLPNLRQGGCECLQGIVNKKQLPPIKLATLRAMRLVDALPEIASMVTSGAPSTDEEEGFMLDVVLLAKSVVAELSQCAEQGKLADAGEFIHTMFAHVVPLFRIPHFQVREIILPWITSYVKSNIISQDEARELLDLLYCQTILPEHELIQPSDETVEQRKHLHNCLRLMYRREADLVMDHCGYVLTQVIASNSGRDARDLPCEMVEGAVRYMFELGEAIRIECLRDAQNPYSQMIRALLHSTVAAHPNPIVHLAYFELFERMSQFFCFFREEVPLLLQQLITEQCGIGGAHAKVRGRVCYLFARLMHTLKREFACHSHFIVDNVMHILRDPAASLLPQDKMDVYEALGMLLSLADLQTLGQVAEDTVAVLQMHCERPSDQGVVAVADGISFLASMAKGIGAVDTTAAAAVAAPAGRGSGAACESPPLSASDGGGRGTEVLRSSPVVQVFAQVTECVLVTLEVYSSSWVVRERAMLFMHQIINILGTEAIPFITDLAPKLLSSTSLLELPRILRLVQQSINKMKEAVAELLGSQLLPQVAEQVAQLCDFSQVHSVMGIYSESVKEHLEAIKSYFMFVHTTVHTSAITALDAPASQAVAVPLLMQHLAWALRASPETELPNKALQILARLASSWCSRGAAAEHDEVPPTALESFLFDEALPLALEVFTTPQQPLDLKDARNFSTVAEFCQLLKTLVSRLGDRGLYAIYGILTAPLPAGMAGNEAFAFCTRLRDEQRASLQLKNAFRGALEECQQRRIATLQASAQGSVVVLQQ